MPTLEPIHDGLSFEQAIVINENTELSGTRAVYTWLAKNYPGYKLAMQFLASKDNCKYDVMLIRTSAGIDKQIHFNISSYFGKL